MTLEQTKKFTEQDENTLQYYNQNATKFIENTKSVEFHSVQDKFLSTFRTALIFWILAVDPDAIVNIFWKKVIVSMR